MEMGVRTVGIEERERIKRRGSDRRKATNWIRNNRAYIDLLDHCNPARHCVFTPDEPALQL
jgi:hypothetical protein